MTEPTPNKSTAAPTPAASKSQTKAEAKAEPVLLSAQKNAARGQPAPSTTPKARAPLLAALLLALLLAILSPIVTSIVTQNRLMEATQSNIDHAQSQTMQAVSGQIQTQIETRTRALHEQIQTLHAQLAVEQADKQQLAVTQHALRDQVLAMEQALQLHTASGGQAVLVRAVEQLVDMAQQQLTLAGNIGQARIALQTAQARLARASFPALAPLQQAINGDLERLRAFAATRPDLAQLAGRLDELGRLLAEAPLLAQASTTEPPAQIATHAADILPQAAPDATSQPDGSDAPAQTAAPRWWEQLWANTRSGAQQLWQGVRQDLRGLISIRRIDDAHALLMSAEQSTQLREQLRLRVMMARLALFLPQTLPQSDAHTDAQPHAPTALWQAEMQAIQAVIQSRYDLHSAAGMQALTLVTQLMQTSIAAELPPTLNSQLALQALQESHDTAADATPPASGQERP